MPLGFGVPRQPGLQQAGTAPKSWFETSFASGAAGTALGNRRQVGYLRCPEREFWEFYSDSRITLQRSGHMGRKKKTSFAEQCWFVTVLQFAFM